MIRKLWFQNIIEKFNFENSTGLMDMDKKTKVNGRMI